MKKLTLVFATFALAFAGCTCGQGWRPNILTRLHNRIHGVANMGEPCDAGGCATAAPVAEYASTGCTNCGNGTLSNYGGYEGEVIHDGMVIGSSVPTTYATPTTTVTPGAGESIVPRRP